MTTGALIRTDVTIIGGGVAGLMLLKKLADIGLSAVLIEQNPRFADSASTKNEGWLHRGTYHAASIRDRNIAIQVARRCIYGYEQIRSYAPETVEDIDMPSFALLRNQDRESEIISRWDEAEVVYRKISHQELKNFVPELNISEVASAFKVKDIGINTRLLYRKLLAQSERLGARVLTRAKISFESNLETAQVETEEGKQKIESDLFVYTAGYGLKQLFAERFATHLPLRFWKSHLLVTQRLSKHAVFFL
ncbi:MAG: FAD-binding oxidoreductase, partial [Nitrososphaera sp.]|nr:FAD-binding oxidoreductase [Nitrososphaera sp.]